MRKIVFGIALTLLLINFAYASTSLLTTRGRVREYLYETDSTNTNYSDTMINESIKQAENMLMDALPASANYNLLQTAAVTLTASKNTYSLPTDFRKLIAASYLNKPCIQVKPEEFYAKPLNATTKDPMFVILNSTIKFFPDPTSGATAEILYLKQVTQLTSDSDTLSTLLEYDNLVVLLATNHLLKLDNQVIRTQGIDQLIQQYITLIQQNIINSNVIEKVPNAK